MAVHLTRIYTQTGDDGTTALGDMSRVRKTDPRLAAYADVDEANSSLGVVLALGSPSAEVAALLRRGAERPVRRRRRPVHAGRAGPGVPAAARDAGVHRAARGGLRRVQRPAGEAVELHPPGRHAGGGAAARRPHRRPPGGALDLGAARGRAGPHRQRAGALPQPALGPAVHPVPGGEPRRRRAVAARRRRGRARPDQPRGSVAAGRAWPRARPGSRSRPTSDIASSTGPSGARHSSTTAPACSARCSAPDGSRRRSTSSVRRLYRRRGRRRQAEDAVPAQLVADEAADAVHPAAAVPRRLEPQATARPCRPQRDSTRRRDQPGEQDEEGGADRDGCDVGAQPAWTSPAARRPQAALGAPLGGQVLLAAGPLESGLGRARGRCPRPARRPRPGS